jgi:hypothetical protein
MSVGGAGGPRRPPGQGPFPGGWNPNGLALDELRRHPMPGGYPHPRAVPIDPSIDPSSGDPSSSGSAGPSHPAERIARLLERHTHIQGRPGGSVTFEYDPSSLQASITSLQFQEVARLEGRVAQRCVIYSSYTQFGNLSNFFATLGRLAPPRVVLRIRIGGGALGGSSNVVQFVPAGVPVAVTGENIYVDAGIFLNEWGDIPLSTGQGFTTGNGITTQLNVTANVFISPGDPTITAQPTAWYPPSGPPPADTWERAANPVWQGPGRIKRIVGYAPTGNSDTDFLQFFDWPEGGSTLGTLPAASVPLLEIVIPPGENFDVDLSQSTRVVSQGLLWAVSSTSGQYTASTDLAAPWIERYSDLQILGNDQAYP